MPLYHRADDGTERLIADRWCTKHDPQSSLASCMISRGHDDYDVRCPVCREQEPIVPNTFVCPFCGARLRIRANRVNSVEWGIDPDTGKIYEIPDNLGEGYGLIDEEAEPVLFCSNDDCGISSHNERATCEIRDRLTYSDRHDIANALRPWQPRTGRDA
jgi:hypothetical protein